ncbi:hypothetical protein CP967_08465 [Streptomyces nitrosporeus]|uniref:Uncharacterized protein n=1 Tax=Streptomyces nitrosporeus TaxID=28894 RepID=A0A5J6F7E7_9ACTN|nr:hypothetical protein [Streptomyces nitrosporeus]QEU71996.1 hypothetical protein CP967_08465 [Streptomyces nitrosporeus]GGY81399.1 hypothetical protein GCM10010327_10090 [Streptomyces nitrosporeus]
MSADPLPDEEPLDPADQAAAEDGFGSLTRFLARHPAPPAGQEHRLMATGPEHYREAERRLTMAWEENSPQDRSTQLVAEAQVHATLALAAATALNDAEDGMPVAEFQAWRHAAGTKRDRAAARKLAAMQDTEQTLREIRAGGTQ